MFRIRERVLSRGDLIGLIEQFELYSEERRSQPMSVIVEKMREATTVGALEGAEAGYVVESIGALLPGAFGPARLAEGQQARGAS